MKTPKTAFMVKRDGKTIGFNYSIGKAKDRIDKDCIVSKNPLIYNNSKYDILEYYDDAQAWFSIAKKNCTISNYESELSFSMNDLDQKINKDFKKAVDSYYCTCKHHVKPDDVTEIVWLKFGADLIWNPNCPVHKL